MYWSFSHSMSVFNSACPFSLTVDYKLIVPHGTRGLYDYKLIDPLHL